MLQGIAFALVAALTAPPASEDQAYFAILAETKVGRMAGMPLPDFSQIPAGMKLPPGAMMFAGKPVRLLNMRLWSPGLAPDGASATVAPPAGLKQGSKLNLEIYRPKGEKSEGKIQGFDPDSNPEFTIKIYWGSSETVKDGQPKVIKWTGLTPEQREAMNQRAREASASMSYFYKPNWTTGYWPTKVQPGEIGLDASLVGTFSLTTSYAGNVDIEAPQNVNFLAPIQMSAPNLDKKIDFKKPMAFTWGNIPNALGQYATIMGMEGKSTMILWSSSETFLDGMMGDMGFLQMAEVRDFVGSTVFMAGDRSNVTVPAGIFQNADFAMMNMAAYGPGAALDKAQPLPRIQTKSTLQIMLGGKKMG